MNEPIVTPKPEPRLNDRGDWVCEHLTAMDVHCCNCHSGFLFDVEACVCLSEPVAADAANTMHGGER